MSIGDPDLDAWHRQKAEENRMITLKYELALSIKGVLGDKSIEQMTPEEKRILQIVNDYAQRAKVILK